MLMRVLIFLLPAKQMLGPEQQDLLSSIVKSLPALPFPPFFLPLWVLTWDSSEHPILLRAFRSGAMPSLPPP